MKPTHLLLTFILCIILISVFSFAPLPTYATSHTGLVSCGFTGPCTICDLITLFQTLVSKANSYFALPLAALMLGYGGFLMVLSGLQGGKASLYDKGKKVLTNAVIGIVIIFCAWLAIDTLLKTIGAYQHANTLSPLSKFGPWHVIECTSPTVKFPKHMGCNDQGQCVEIDGFAPAGCTNSANCTEHQHLGCVAGSCTLLKAKFAGDADQTGADQCTISPESCPPEHHICQQGACITTTANVTDNCNPFNGNGDKDCIASGISTPINKDAAKKLQEKGVRFSSSGDCKDADGRSVSASTNLEEMLNEKPLTVCNAQCKTSGNPCVQTNITADGDMMFKLVQVRESGKEFNINSITTGKHGQNSDHYQGKAVDLSAVGGTTYADLKAQFEPALLNGIRLAQCENENGDPVKNCGPSTNHLHVSYK